MKARNIRRLKFCLGSGILVLFTALLVGQIAAPGYGKPGPKRIEVSFKKYKLPKIEKQKEFGIGIEYIPEDFYYDEDVREEGRKFRRAGEGVFPQVIRPKRRGST